MCARAACGGVIEPPRAGTAPQRRQAPTPATRSPCKCQGTAAWEKKRRAVGEGAIIKVVADEAARVVRHVHARLSGDGLQVDARRSRCTEELGLVDGRLGRLEGVLIGHAERGIIISAAFQRDRVVGDGHADMDHEPGVGAAPRLRGGGRHFQNLDGIAFGRVLRREALREDGRRVRLDALELAEAGPGDAHFLRARRLASLALVCRRNAVARCSGRSLVVWHRCCSSIAP